MIVVIIVVVVVLLVVVGRSCAGDRNNPIKDSGVMATIAEAVEHSVATSDILASVTGSTGVHRGLEPLDFLAVPASSEIIRVDLVNDGETEPFASSELSSVRKAIAQVEEYGSCGFVFIDMNTGRGFAYNADAVTYIASAAKAPMAYYALLHGAGADEFTRGNIEGAIVDSDNDAFEGFAYNYANEEYNAWLIEHGVYHDDYYYDLYPPMSARSLASFWAEILNYLQGDSDDAKWFAGLLASTTTSFIRDGVQDTGASVINKGGWIAEEGYASVSDAGIIELDGHVYIMAIVTGASDWGVTEANVTELASALFEARDIM